MHTKKKKKKDTELSGGKNKAELSAAMGPPTPLSDPEQHEPRKDSIPAEPFGQTSTPGLHQCQGSGRVSCYCSLLGRL